MLSISIMELLPDAISEIGFVAGQLWFYIGVAFFAVVVAFIPEPDSSFLAAAVAGRCAAYRTVGHMLLLLPFVLT